MSTLQLCALPCCLHYFTTDRKDSAFFWNMQILSAFFAKIKSLISVLR